jgi:glycosyltransferase involved in cell wall biosynthesis
LRYPSLEVIVIDGGSTDNSIEIIKRYEQQITFWTSENDLGQSHAINKGFSQAAGAILGWLNSDDMYLPGTLDYVARQLNPSRPELLFGNCFHFVENTPNSWGSDVKKAHEDMELTLCDYIIQPATFWTRTAWSLTGELDETLHYGFDWDWFIRARRASVALRPDDRYLAIYRVHDAHKTTTGGDRRLQELRALYRKHAGAEYEKIFSSLCDQRPRIALRSVAMCRGCHRQRGGASRSTPSPGRLPHHS